MAYTEQITFLLFLKMADELIRPPYNRTRVVPAGLDWRGNKSGQASAVQVSETTYCRSDGVYAVDFARCPEKLPRPYNSSMH
jgi:hypothetical protein